MGCPLLVVCCCGRVSAECFGTCQPLGRRGAPLSHCRVGSVGCAGIWQLCDEVRTVWCRSRFVLLAQQAIPAMQLLGATRTIWSAVDARPTRPRKARVDAWKRGRMTAFFTLWKLAALRRAAPPQQGIRACIRGEFHRHCRIDAESTVRA